MATPNIIAIPAAVGIQAAEGGLPRRFKIEPAYSGGELRIAGFDLPLVVDLATLTIDEQVVANLDHKPEARVGHVDQHANDGKSLRLAGVVSAVSVASREFIESSENKFPWAASIEADPGRVETIDRGKTVKVNGREFRGPLYVTRNSGLYGIAILSKGADSQARAMLATSRGKKMDPAFTDWAQQMSPGADLSDPDIAAGLHANFHGRTDVTPADHAAVAGMIQASGAIDDEELRLRRVERSLQREERLQKLEASIPMAHTVSTSHRGGFGDTKVITAAFCILGGIAKPEQHFSEQVLDAADKASRGLGLQSLLMQAACQAGYQARPGEYVTDGNLRQVLTAAFAPQIQAQGWSTLAISNVLSNTANKMLLDGFTEIEDPWRSIAAVKPVKNFKEHTFVRLLDSLEFEEVGPAGEIKHGTLADTTMTARASTYAKMLAITRQDIINDDLSALTDVPRRLGRAAMQKFRRLFWAAFNASDGFFAGGNGNIVGTGDERLSEAGLTVALAAFRAQTTPAADGSKLIGGKPAVLLVPPALEIAARRQLTSSGIVSGTDGMIPSGNPFQNLAELAVGDFLSTAQGGSDQVWYLFRSPSLAPAMLVAALNGRVEPTIETADADFSTLGVLMRGYSDCGVGRGEKLCGLLLDGTSS